VDNSIKLSRFVDKSYCKGSGAADSLWSSRRGHGNGVDTTGSPEEPITEPGGSFGRFFVRLGWPYGFAGSTAMTLAFHGQK